MLGRANPLSPDLTLGFALQLANGKGLLLAKNRPIGALELKLLELEVPDLDSPFDITGGPEAFKMRRLHLQHLVVAAKAHALHDLVQLAVQPEAARGFRQLHVTLGHGRISFGGQFAFDGVQVPVSFQATAFVQNHDTVGLVFYNIRVHGFLPVPAIALPQYLLDMMPVRFLKGEQPTLWTCNATEQFLRYVMPRAGWKVPGTQDAGLVAIETSSEKIVLIAGRDVEPAARKIPAREPPTAAVYETEQSALWRDSEEIIAQGDYSSAFRVFQDAWSRGDGGRFIEERLLSFGAAGLGHSQNATDLAQEILEREPKHIGACLTLAALAQRKEEWGDAERYLTRVSELCGDAHERHGQVGAQLAAAQIAENVAPEEARANYEATISKDRSNVLAHRGLFRLHVREQDWAAARGVGQRLTRLDLDPEDRAEILCELGTVCRDGLKDFKQARLSFERALRSHPNFQPALLGLAETFAARGEPARAAVYLGRLAEEAARENRKKDVTKLYQRIGQLWEEQLGDIATASEYYRRILKVDPDHRPVRFRLAKLAWGENNLEEARLYYEDILTLTQNARDESEVADAICANGELATIALDLDGREQDAIDCFERILTLMPGHQPTLEAIGPLLWREQRWGRLVEVQESLLDATEDSVAKGRIHFDCAKILYDRLHEVRAARRHLETILDEDAGHPAALELLCSILQLQQDSPAYQERLSQAAMAEQESERRAELYGDLYDLLVDMDAGPDSLRGALIGALDAAPEHLELTQQLLTLTRENGTPEQLANALKRRIELEEEPSDLAALHLEMGHVCQGLELYQNAQEHFEKATRSNPTLKDAWWALADLQKLLGEYSACTTTLSKALHNLTGEPEETQRIHAALASLNRTIGDDETEALHLGQVVDFGEYTDADCMRLTELLAKLGRHTELGNRLESWALRGQMLDADSLYMRAARIWESTGEVNRSIEIYEMLVRKRGYSAYPAATAFEVLAAQAGDLEDLEKALLMQLEVAPPADVAQIFERLARFRIEHHSSDVALKTCRELLEHNPFSALAQDFLGTHADECDDYFLALDYGIRYLTNHSQPRSGTAEGLRKRYTRLSQIASELRPDGLEELRQAYACDFPGDKLPSAEPLGTLFWDDEQFEKLIELRLLQVERDAWFGELPIEFELAKLYHHATQELDSALAWYQKTNNAYHDTQVGTVSRDAIVSILTLQKQYEALAESCLDFARREEDIGETLRWGIQSATIYYEKLARFEKAKEVIWHLLEMGESGDHEEELLSLLRKLSETQGLISLLRTSLERNWDVEDGRFSELVDLLAHKTDAPEEAVALAERGVETFTYLDLPHKTLADLCSEFDGFGDTAQVYHAWANAREGEARLEILLDRFHLLDRRGENDLALRTLELAAECAPDPSPILEQLISKAWDAEHFERALGFTEELYEHLDSGEEREACLKRIVGLALDHCAAPEVAEEAIERSAHKQPLLANLVEYYLDVEDFNNALKWQRILADYLSGEARYNAYLKVGQIALSHAGRPRVAEQALGELRDNTELADQLIQYYMDSGDIARALRWLQSVVEALPEDEGNPQRLETWVKLALEEQSDVPSAMRAIEHARRHAPLLEFLLNYHLKVEDYDAALETLERLAVDAQNDEARQVHLYRMADLAIKKAGQPGAVERAIELSHAPTDLIEKYVSFLLARDAFQPCINWLLRLHAAAENPSSGETYVDRILNIALDSAEDVELADQAVVVSTQPAACSERIIHFLLSHERYAETLVRLERLASAADSKEARDACLMRMVELGLGAAEDRLSAERAVGLASDPRPILNAFLEHDEGQGDYIACVGHLSRLLAITKDPEARERNLSAQVDFGLVHLGESAIAERAIELSADKVPLARQLVDFLAERERYSDAMQWLEKLAGMVEDEGDREAILRRLVNLALHGGADESAAERAIALSGDPRELVETLILRLLEEERFLGAIKWLEFLAKGSVDEDEREGYLARMMELSLGLAQDVSSAERVIGLSQSPTPLIEELILYLDEAGNGAGQLTWLEYLCAHADQEPSRQNFAERLFSLCLEMGEPQKAERATTLAPKSRVLVEELVAWHEARGELADAARHQETLVAQDSEPGRRVFDTHRLFDLLLDGLGDAPGAQRIIEISHEPAPFIERLIAFHETRGEYPAALRWLERLVDSASHDVTEMAYRHRYVDLALGAASRPADAERSILASGVDPGLTEKFIAWHLERADFSAALRWTEQLALAAQDNPSNLWLRRMFDLALGEADDLPAAERAIGLSQSAGAFIERLVEHLLENFEFAEALRWLEELSQIAPRGHVRDARLGSMQELALVKLGDVHAAERAIQMADDQAPLMRRLVDYLRETGARPAALEWLRDLAKSTDDLQKRRGVLEEMLRYALLDPARHEFAEEAISHTDRPAPLIELYIEHLSDLAQHEAVLDWLQRLGELSTLQEDREICSGRALRVALRDLDRPEFADALIDESQEPAPLIEELIDWYMDQGDYENALRWSWKLVDGALDAGERESMRRRVAELALGLADDPRQAARALSQLENPHSQELGELAELYVDAGEFEELYDILPRLNGVEPELLLRAARHHLIQGELDRARFYMQGALDRGFEHQEIWAMARGPFRDAERGLNLGQWMLEHAASVSPDEPHRLRLDAYRQMLDSGVGGGTLGEPGFVVKQFDLANLEDLGEARLVYQAATSIGHKAWSKKAARALEVLLDSADPLYPSILKTRIEEQEAEYDYPSVARLARRLIALGDETAQGILERALAEGGESAELLTVLHTRLAKGDGDPRILLTRIARIYQKAQRWSEVCETLDEFNPGHIDEHWAALAWEAGEHCQRSDLQAQAAALLTDHAQVPSEQAMWCRREARVRWWQLGEREIAEDLLRQAQLMAPRRASEWLKESHASEPKEAECRLHEGLVSFPDESGFTLLLELAEVYAGGEREDEAVEVLSDAARRVLGDPERLLRVAERCVDLSATDLRIQVLEQAYRANHKHHELFESALFEAARFEKLIDVMVTRAHGLEVTDHRTEAANVLGRAAEIAREHLGDPKRALELLERRAGLIGSVENLSGAFDLAFEREDFVAQERLLRGLYLATENPQEKIAFLREIVRTQERQGFFEETTESLSKLLELGAATEEEKLRLASFLLDTEPLHAAQIMEAVGDLREGIDAGQLYFEACYGYSAAESLDDAARVIQSAIDSGFNRREVFEQALVLLQGSGRADALSAYLSAGGNPSWDLHQNQAHRLELANLRLEADEGAYALEAAEAGLLFGETRDLVQVRERALIQLDRRADLARWYLDESIRPDSKWDRAELVERLKTASRYYRTVEDLETERMVLVSLEARGDIEPEYLDRALIIARATGDYAGYTALIPSRLAVARDGKEADQLTVFFATQLAQDFDAPAAGLELVRSRLKVHPNLGLAECVQDLYEIIGRPEECFDVYRYLLELHPTDKHLLVTCVDQSFRFERFEDAVELLSMQAQHFEKGETAYRTAARAAGLAVEKIPNTAREIDCLELCLNLRSGRVAEATPLGWRYCEQERLAEAEALLTHERLPLHDQLALALELLRRYREHDAEESAFKVEQWIVDHHPLSPPARQLKLDRARRAGEPERLVEEIREALLSVDELEGENTWDLHREAARVFAGNRQAGEALDMLMPLLEHEEVPVSDLYDAGALAAYTGRVEERKEIVALVRENLDEFSVLAKRYEAQARSFGHSLLGEAYSELEREAEATQSHHEALKVATDHLPRVSIDYLSEHFERDENYRGLIALNELQLDFVADESEKIAFGLEVARLYRDEFGDVEKAETALNQCLGWDENCLEALAQLGDFQFSQGRFEESVDYLTRYLDRAEDPELEYRTRLVVALRNVGQFERAMVATEKLLEMDVANRDAREIRVEILDARGDAELLEAELQAYEELLDDQEDNRLKFRVQSRLGQLALERDSLVESRTWFEKASLLNQDDSDTVGFLRGIAESEERWEDAAVLGELELERVDSGVRRREQLEHLQHIYRDKLSDESASHSALRKAAELSPEDVELQNALMEHYREQEEWENYLATAVNLMNVADPDELGTSFFTQVAQVYQDQRGDLESARLFYTKAMEYDPSDLEAKDKGRVLARDTGDFRVFADLESELIPTIENEEERVCRAYELAFTFREKLGDSKASRTWLDRAHDMVQNDLELARDIAEKYTLETSTYPVARDVYRGILKTLARDPEVTRILARLSGQIGDVDRAYGYYSTLSAIVPSDDEARGYIVPCRRARPKVAARAIKDIERMSIAPPAAGTTLVAALMNPLARHAEALQRGEMQLRGVTERDRMEPTDKRASILTQVLESVGLSHHGIYLWRGGGFECGMALDAGPSVLLGSTLAADATDGERIFLVARAAELYRKGHTLCSRLSAGGLQSTLGAMAMAIDPSLEPRGMRDETKRAASQIGAALLPNERERLLETARDYVENATLEDIETFQLSTLKAANRVAVALSGDVEEAINALLRVAGRDSLVEDGRGALQHGSDEARDLVDFGISESFFEVREALGLTLPKRET